MIARRSLAVFALILALVAVLSMNSGSLAPAPANAVPANDNLANAIPITAPAYSGMVAYTNTAGATFEAGEVSPCGAIGATVWYTWTSPASPGTLTFETLGSDFDTVLAIYTGVGFPLSNVACSDDWLQGNKSAITLSYAASTTYRIQVGGWNGSSGNAALYVGRGATIVVSSTSDANADDGQISLREAILLARGGTGAGGINRALGGGEALYAFNAGSAGPSGFDVVHFSPSLFLSASPVSILVPISDGLPFLDSTGDTITGVGAGVVIDGQNTVEHACLTVTGSSNHLEGLEVRRCVGGYDGIRVQGPANVVGGSITPAQRNIARENSLGIAIDTASAIGNVVVGNYVGTDRTGTIGMGNEDAGIFVGFGAYDNTIGGPAPNEMNLISDTGPGGTGIKIRDSDSNQVYGNKLGTDVTGTVPLPNNSYGITIDVGSLDNVIGGISPGQANVVANSTGNGVRVDGIATLRNSIRGNSIHSSSGSGIDLIGGGNVSRPAPTITNVAGGAVSGFACSLCTVDVYNDTADEGRVYLGTGTADVAGSFVLYDVAHALANITATVTDSLANTSEFSAPYSAAANSDGDSLSDSFDGCVFDPEDYDGWDDGDGCPDPDNDGDGVCDAGMASVGCAGSDLGRYLWKNPLGSTIDCRNVAEDIDSFHDTDGCPEPDNDYDTFPDHTDDCPGTDTNAGPDGISDTGDEPVLYLTPYQAREDFDGVIDTDGCHDSPNDDYDGDGAGDETEVLTMQTDPVNPDTDADTVIDGTDNCPNWPNGAQALPAWPVPGGGTDTDCDGFTVARETWTGTDPRKHCNADSTLNNEPDAWPSDFNDSRLTSLADVVLMGPVYNQSTGTDPAKKRFDLNASGVVSLADVVLMGPFYNKSCT